MKKIDASDVVRVLNEALKADHDAIATLVDYRVPCNEELTEHPTIQVQCNLRPMVGILGILNGILGDVGIMAVYDYDGTLLEFSEV